MLSAIPLYDPPYADLTVVGLDGLAYYLAQYRADLIAQLRLQAGVTFIDLPRYLDDYAARAAAVPADRFAADLAFFDAFYFRDNPDPARRAALLAGRSAEPR
jgi:hypothetical protein